MGDSDEPETRPDSPRWNRSTAVVKPSTEPIAITAKSAFDPNTERFTIGDELGRGGMGRVVAATDTTLDRAVAIKQALADDSENLARFEREVRITAKLEHPAIVPVHDAGRDAQGRPYYIMRRIEGEPLSDRVAGDVRSRLALVPNVLAAVDAAAFAHARGVIHRDIKPWNILVGAYGETLLIDWGLARALDDSEAEGRPSKPSGDHALTRLGHAYGTPGYMAPEQARGERVDARSDVYSLGATLYHVLVGKPVFEGSAPDEWTERIAKGTARVPVDKIPDEVPRELVTIVAKATANDATERYPDAGALAGDLRAFLAGQLVASHEYTALERIGRFVRRHRIAVATAAIALAATIAIGVVAIVNVIDERQSSAAARAVAADRRELILIERASTLAQRDPTRAVALLRDLPVTSPYLRRARDIASIAAASGIARGTLAHRGRVTGLALSPDGKLLASGGGDDGRLVLHDLASGTTRILVTLAKEGEITKIDWIDGGKAIVFVTADSLERVEVATGTRDVLVTGRVMGIWTAPDRLRYRRESTLYERIGNAEPSVLAENVSDVEMHDDVVLYLSNDELRVRDAAGTRALGTIPPKDYAGALAISSTGALVAASLGPDIVEWDRVTGVERRRWPNRRSLQMAYFGEQLHARINTVPGLDRLDDNGRQAEVARTRARLYIGATKHGTVLLGNDGTFNIISGGRSFRYDQTEMPVQSLAAIPSTSIVAAGMTDGSVRWWDTNAFMPHVVSIPTANICGFDAERIYVQEHTEIITVPRDGSAPRATSPSLAIDCSQLGRGRLAIGTNKGTDIVEGASGASTLVASHGVVLDTATSSAMFLEDRVRVVEIARDGRRLVRLETPEPITYLTTRKGWVAAVSGRRIVRVTPSGATVWSEPLDSIDHVAVDGRGTVWIAAAQQLLHWDGKRVQRVATLPIGLVTLFGLATSGAALRLQDTSIAFATEAGLVQRASAATGERRIEFGLRAAVQLEIGVRIELHYLDTGERLVRSTSELVHRVLIGDEDRTLVAQTTGIPRAVMIYEDTGPAEVASLHAWIDTVTNAVIARDSDVLTWR